MAEDAYSVGEPTSTSPSMALSSSIFISELMKMSSDIIWKNMHQANASEKPQYSITVDEFLAAHKGLLNFDTIFRFTLEDLEAAGITGELAELCIDDKTAVPAYLRPVVVAEHIQRLLQKDPNTGHYTGYMEYNNYYRMLMGLPDIGDTEFIYNQKYTDIPMDIPVHQLNIAQRYQLESRGYTEELIKKNPEKRYLYHIGLRSIDFYAAREAQRFSILFNNPSEYPNMESDFKDCYRDCMNQISRIYYSDAFRKNNSVFEGFIAMCIMFMTVQLMNYRYLDADITRDFYDLESIRYIYQSYGVPFYSSIPLNYHKAIIKSINRLISYKGSTRVFYELFDLFGFGILDVYEYYIIKTHRMDENGNPIFVKKEDGSPDLRAMYELLFGKVRLYDDPPLELSDPTNHLDYDTMTTNDPYWVSDPELLDKLYNEKFNYLETKYVGIQTLFNMMQIMYESCYFFRMIQDNRATLESAKIYMTSIDRYIGIFDIIIYTCALICKRNGFEGNLANNLPSTAKVIGYNFKEGLKALQKYVRESPSAKADPHIEDLIRNMDVSSLPSVNNTLKNILDLHSYLNNRMAEVRTREEWHTYSDMQRLLLYTELNEQVYKKKDGTTAESFQDLLADINPELYARFANPEVDANLEVDTMLVLLHKSITNLKYIESAAGLEISTMIEHLFKIMEFFKSAKSELTGYTIVYTLTTRGMNIMKFIDEIETYSHDGQFVDKMQQMKDIIYRYMELQKMKMGEIPMTDWLGPPHLEIELRDKIDYLKDVIAIIEEALSLAFEKFPLDDVIESLTTETVMGSWLNLRDADMNTIYVDYHYVHTNYSLRDEIQTLKDAIYLFAENRVIPLKDVSTLHDRIDRIVETLEYPLGYRQDSKILWGDRMNVGASNIRMMSEFPVKDQIDRYNEKENMQSNQLFSDRWNHLDYFWKLKDAGSLEDRHEVLDLKSPIGKSSVPITDKTWKREYLWIPKENLAMNMKLLSTVHTMPDLPKRREILTLEDSVSIRTENKDRKDVLSMQDRLFLVSMVVEK